MPTVAAGGLTVALVDTSALQSAGLAFPAVATLFAVFLFAPIARQDWLDDRQKPLAVVSESFAQVALLGSIAAAATTLAPAPYAWTIPLAWVVALLLAFCGRITPLSTGALLIAVLGLATWKLGASTPWSLLDPSVDTIQSWLPRALLCGALASGAPGIWKRRALPRPGRLAAPHLAIGFSLLGVVGVCVLWAAHFEGGTPTVVSQALVGAVITGSAGTLLQDSPRTQRLGFVLAGLLASVWFLMTDASGVALWWGAWAPTLLGLSWAFDAWRRRSAITATASGALILSVLWGFPGVPSLILPAIAAVIPVVVGLWFVGTQTLWTRRA